ncbi:NAD(+) diphosphatase [Xanthobacter sp. TB0139]|uniref:NAD(+) diphosphatase n=1 Tax=Xanthobacter sp. TB0139 TaxID=3459178 RepID=UPI004039EF83
MSSLSISSLFPLSDDSLTPSRITYAESGFDRAAHLRTGSTPLLDAPQARGLLVGAEMVAMRLDALSGTGSALFPISEARIWQRGQPIFIGLENDAPLFAFSFDPARQEDMEAAGLRVQDLRGIAMEGLVPGTQLGALACAKALMSWHGRHRFCSNCGARTEMMDSGWRRECPACNGQHFPRTDPVVIMLVAQGDQALLGRQTHFRPGMYSCLAGFVEPGETPEEAVRRETLEEAGIQLGPVRYFASQPWPFPMSLMLGFLAEATSSNITMDPNELEDVRWVHRDEVAQMLTRTHPQELFAPGPEAIAHHLMRAFVEKAR